MKYLIFILCLIFFSFPVFSQKDVKLLRKGNKLYEQGKYKDAEIDYRKALEINKDSEKGKFNLGTAVYQEKNFNESSKIYEELAAKKLDKSTQAKVWHNFGNSLLEAKQYEQSIAAYKNALLNEPSDLDTKYNLEYAKMMLKKQQQQQQQNDKNKDQEKKDQDKKDQDKQNQDQQKQDQDKNQQQDQTKKISKEDAERMLEAMKNDEKKTLAKLKKAQAKVQQVQIEKDW